MPNDVKAWTRHLQSPALIKLKAVLFLLACLFASALLILEHPTLKMVFLLAVAVWSFCRLYYFLFHVIEHSFDPAFRCAGLLDFARYAQRGPKA